MRRNLLALLIGLSLLILVAGIVVAEEKDEVVADETILDQTVSIANEYIRIVVNAEPENTGRFALETTGGDPDRASDDGLPLIYGRPKPWTSYTTVRVGTDDYVFGGSTTKRAGLNGLYGEVVAGPIIQGDGIDTIALIGPLEVLQRIEFAYSSTTGYRDSARIIYRVTNISEEPQQVGLRIMLDTQLGSNDGAPFRFGEQAILDDAEFWHEALPEFWQAFDALREPKVIAQGTLIGPDMTRPDRIVFSNWGSFADGLWDIDFRPGREFLRLGEFELDSAVGLYWQPRVLMPGESRTYVTGYGMGGLSISPGELSLGLTSPSTVALGSDGKARIPVVAYLENTGAGIGRDLVMTLRVPRGMSFVGGSQAAKTLGYLRPGRSTQASWELEADQSLAGKTVSLRVEVTGPDIKTIAVERPVRILEPPKLDVILQPQLRDDGSGYFVINAVITNAGQSNAYNVEAALELPAGWQIAPRERASRFLGEIEPGEKLNWQWQVKPEPGAAAEGLKVQIKSTNTQQRTVEVKNLQMTAARPRVTLQPKSQDNQVNSLALISINARDIFGFSGFRAVVNYEPRYLAFLGYSRGQMWVDADGRTLDFRVEVNPQAGQLIIEGKLPSEDGIYTGEGEVVELKFLPLAPGRYRIDFAEAPLIMSSVPEQEIQLEVHPLDVSDIFKGEVQELWERD